MVAGSLEGLSAGEIIGVRAVQPSLFPFASAGLLNGSRPSYGPSQFPKASYYGNYANYYSGQIHQIIKGYLLRTQFIYPLFKANPAGRKRQSVKILLG